MNAAVVSEFGEAPRYEELPVPSTVRPDEVLIEVLAAGLHPRVRSQAAGSHYTSTDELPLVPGIDGVGRTEDGTLRYFILPDTTMGSLAEKTVVDLRRSIELRPDTDSTQVAAAMNPAMSSWIALRRRIQFEPGQSVLVLGATGNAGQLAVQVAKFLGASQVVAVGRNARRLTELQSLGADPILSLEGPPEVVAESVGEAAKDIDVVLDYLWGQPTSDMLRAIIPRRSDDTLPLTWVQIGSVAGLESPIPSAALRAARLQILGSGQGSVSTSDIVAELSPLAEEISRGTFEINAREIPLSNVSHAWAEAATGSERIVLVP